MKQFLRFWLSLLILNTVCQCEESSRRTKRSNWDAFLLGHTLNPGDPRNSNYEYWTPNDWDYWLRLREPLHDAANCYHGTPLVSKGFNTVIIGSPRAIEGAFTGRLIPYGYNGFYWSNRSFKTYVLHRNGRYLDVYDCGHLYFAARLKGGLPVHFHTAFPEEYYYPFSGDLHYNLYKHCYRVPLPSPAQSRHRSSSNNQQYSTNFYRYQ
ncbi:unnamed protein product [Allacma fusca]|uniref:Uncharacterized protein n=1 Tax=Allacma fusca TaxID=39272 RepID=A0A8J2LG55_9HEXA|nr:unnamed protein product [Allacma fusca]